MKKIMMLAMLMFLCASVITFAQEANAVLADESGAINTPAAGHEQIPPVELDNLGTEAAEAVETEQIPPVELDNRLTETVNAAPSVEDILPAPAAAVKPKIAVYVTSGADKSMAAKLLAGAGAYKIVGDGLAKAIGGAGKCDAVNLTGDITKAHGAMVGEAQAVAIGSQFGVQYLSIVTISNIKGKTFNLGVRLVDAAAAKPVASASDAIDLSNAPGMLQSLGKIAKELVKGIAASAVQSVVQGTLGGGASAAVQGVTQEALGGGASAAVQGVTQEALGGGAAAAPAPYGQPVQQSASAVVKPKIAVYVTGGKDVGENKALGTYILDALAASNRYTTIERSEAFLAEIDNEQVAQRSGAIDDSQISRLGKQSGVQFVCVADITQALRGSQISARILDVETAEVVTVGVSTSPLKTMDDLRKVSAAIVEAMFRKLYPDEYKSAPIPEKKLKFGIRAAYNNSFVSKMHLDIIPPPGGGGKMDTISYYGKMGAGSGFEIGAVTLVGLTDALAFNFSPGVIIRKPFVSDIAEVSELAISVPALFEWRLFGGPLRAVCGIQFEIPFNVMIKWEGEEAVDFSEYGKRAGMDFSVVVGASVHIMRNMAVDLRGNIGLREFESETNGFLNQVSVGFSYLY